MITKPIPYGHQSITQEDVDAVIAALKSDYMTQGPLIGEFEKNFANYLGCKYACMVSNGTAALHLCAMALDIKAGEKFTEDNVHSVRPGFGLHPKYLPEVLGKTAACDLEMGERFSLDMIKD